MAIMIIGRKTIVFSLFIIRFVSILSSLFLLLRLYTTNVKGVLNSFRYNSNC